MTKSDLDKLVYNHIKQVDKWYRLYMGLESVLTEFKNDTLYIKIKINPTWKKDHVTTARQLANDWRRFNPELFDAKNYNVKIRDVKRITGIVLSANQVDNHSDLNELINNLKRSDSEPTNTSIHEIEISGVFDETR